MNPKPENGAALLDAARMARFFALRMRTTEYRGVLAQVVLELESEALALRAFQHALETGPGLFGGRA